MKSLETNELVHVTGGAATVAPKQADPKLEYALTRLQSDLKDLAKPQQNNLLMPMMMAMIASRR